MQKSFSDTHECVVTDPAAFVARLQEQRGRSVLIDPEMQALFDECTSDDEPSEFILTDEGRTALRTRAVCVFIELQRIIKEAAGVFDMNTPKSCRAVIAQLGELETAVGNHIDSAQQNWGK